MKRYALAAWVLTLVAVMVMGIAAGNAWAANSMHAGEFGLNVDVNDNFIVSGKLFVQKDLAVLAGLGLGVKGGDAEGTDIGLLAGVRKYLKVDDFAPFVGGTAFYSSTRDGNQKDLSLFAEFGAEYFLGQRFSVEGKTGFGYISSEEKTVIPASGITPASSSTVKTTTIGTERFGVSFNFYF